MRLAVGADELHPLALAVIKHLGALGHQVLRFGPLAEQPGSWPDVARQVAEAVAGGEAEEGILFCWTGTGVSMAANKVPGIRAALCADSETARGARLWNDANVLCLSLRTTSEPIAREILQVWFETVYQPNAEDDACLSALRKIEAARSAPSAS
jgi:ribose 5-phosphate isomerase B